MNIREFKSANHRKDAGLTLVEVTLAIGLFTFAMAILLGLLAPMLTDLSNVLDADETQAIVNKVEVYLDTYDQLTNVSPFQEIYEEVAASGFLEVFIYRTIGGQIRVTGDSTVIDSAMVASTEADLDDMVDRRVFLALIYPSTVNPQAEVSGPTPLTTYTNIDGYTLVNAYAAYPEGYLAFNVEVFGYDAPAPGESLSDAILDNPPSEAGRLLSFPTAINR